MQACANACMWALAAQTVWALGNRGSRCSELARGLTCWVAARNFPPAGLWLNIPDYDAPTQVRIYCCCCLLLLVRLVGAGTPSGQLPDSQTHAHIFDVCRW